ncbi:MAG TPA: hypothetical protein VK528_01530 [Flavobacterium sp.]|nr:hypothetical protein [Flavobacterium sp.]
MKSTATNPGTLKKAPQPLSMQPMKPICRYLFLGTDSFNMAKNKIEAIGKELETWKDASVGTDF